MTRWPLLLFSCHLALVWVSSCTGLDSQNLVFGFFTVPGLRCGTWDQFPDQGLYLSPLTAGKRVIATGLPRVQDSGKLTPCWSCWGCHVVPTSSTIWAHCLFQANMEVWPANLQESLLLSLLNGLAHTVWKEWWEEANVLAGELTSPK